MGGFVKNTRGQRQQGKGNTMKLRRKILFAIILLVFIPVILMGIVTYVNFSNAMEKNQVTSTGFHYSKRIESSNSPLVRSPRSQILRSHNRLFNNR